MILYDISYVQLKNNTKEYTCKTETSKKKKKEKRFRGFTGGSLIKSLPASAGGVGSILGQDDPLQEEMQPTPVFLPGESHGQQSLAGYSPWGLKELDMT